MMPSPARRSSPGREIRSLENTHKRGRSIDHGHPNKNQDEDLTLFTDMQTKEKANLTLLSNEDFDDSLAKLKSTSDYPFGLSVHICRGSNDLLNAESEKNDYDWLLTPPDTPLFPYLDDDENPPSNLSLTRGRSRDQSMHGPRSSTTEKSQKSSRSSESPHRFSPSPRSSSSVTMSRGRSPSTQSSSVPAARQSTPSRRSLTPNKPSSPAPRSPSPVFRRMTTDYSLQAPSSARRGSSPMKGSRGDSSSPKLQGSQSSIPGFSSDAPANLRTSLSDMPNPYSRGSSPASRNGRARQSMSPTVSRSISSSHSNDPDRLSHHSKDSAASFADDVDSLSSITRGSSASSVTRKGSSASNSSMGFSKGPSRQVTANSTPKRSLDSTLQQMEHYKAPRNMFRPLLSSVPISSFYIGKANLMHRPIFSRNSSLTTSSNASSDVGGGIFSEHGRTGRDGTGDAVEWDKVSDSLLQEEGFVFEKANELKEDMMHDLVSEKSLGEHEDSNLYTANDIDLDSQNSHFFVKPVAHPIEQVDPIQQESYGRIPCMDNNLYEKLCSICMKVVPFAKSIDTNVVACEACSKMDERSKLLPSDDFLSYQDENISNRMVSTADNVSCNEPQLVVGCSENFHENVDMEIARPLGGNTEQSSAHHLGSDPALLNYLQSTAVNHVLAEPKCHKQCWEIQSTFNEKDQQGSSSLQLLHESELCNLKTRGMQTVDFIEIDNRSLQSQSIPSNSSLEVDNPYDAGTSALMLRCSSCNKETLVQTKVSTASGMQHDESTNARESMDIIQPTFSRDSSVSSSLDMGMSRQVEALLNRQKSSKNLTKISHNPMSSPADVGTVARNFSQDIFSEIEKNDLTFSEMEKNDLTSFPRHDQIEENNESVFSKEKGHNDGTFSSSSVNLSGESTWTAISMQMDGPPGSSTLPNGNCKMDCSVTVLQTDHNFISHDDSEVDGSMCDVADEKEFSVTSLHVFTSKDEENSYSAQPSSPCTYPDTQTVVTADCKDMENKGCYLSADNAEPLHSYYFSLDSENDVSASAIPCEEHVGVEESSTVLIEELPRGKLESFTGTEATDPILFCSSIIQDLVHKATTIGIEKEVRSTSRLVHPTAAVMDKDVFSQRDIGGFKKHTMVSLQVKRNVTENEMDFKKNVGEPETHNRSYVWEPVTDTRKNVSDPETDTTKDVQGPDTDTKKSVCEPEADADVEASRPLKFEKLQDAKKADLIPYWQVETPRPPSKCNCMIM